MLYYHEHQQVFNSHNVEFNKEEGLERVTIDSEEDDGKGNGGGESGVLGDKCGNPEGGQRMMDHQEIQRTSGNDDRVIPSSLLVLPVSTDTNAITPPMLCRLTRTTKGVPCICANEDPKLELGSRSPSKRDTHDGLPAVGMRGRTTNEDGPPPHTNEEEVNTLYLKVDVPHLYQEAMGHPDADKWTVAIAEEYNNLQ